MPISSRRQTAPTARPKAKTAATTPLLDPSKRIVTARPKQAPRRLAASANPRGRPRRQARANQAEKAWKQAQAIARFLWRHRREPNLWLSLLVAAEVLVLLGLLIAYQALSV